MTYLDALRAETNLTHTENGAVTNKSALNAVVDFFSLAGAMRSNPEGAADLFEKAFHEDRQTAVRTLFYLRDVRGGQGEREVFRAGLLRLLVLTHTKTNDYSKVARFIPEYGRWDDLLHPFTNETVLIIRDQLKIDLLGYAASPLEPVSLMAKWLPSEGASSSETKALARRLRNALGYSSPEYRRILSKLRSRIKLLEHDMSKSNWNEIDYGRLPSQAHRKHVKAFQRHTPDRYQTYLDSVTKGEAKINVSALYPHEIYDAVREGKGSYADVAWANLPDYTNGKNALVMADVSGSMTGRPMSVSVSLALYFAERNKGAFHNYFMTFSANPQLVQVVGTNLQSRMSNIQQAEWAMNTDLLKAFRAILSAATAAGEPPPEVLYIISDMEFDAAQPRGGGQYQRQFRENAWGQMEYRDVYVPAPSTAGDTIFRTARREFADAGFQLPHVVFWNVNARNEQAPATILDGSVSLVSGCSPTVFGMAVEGKSPLQLVHDVVNSERYSRIVI